MDYRGYTLHEIPPNSQGIVALMALGMLEHFELKSHAVDGPDSLHLQIEAQKLAFADAWRYVADPAHMDVKPEQLMSFGVMGGTMQPQGHAQVMVRIADYGQHPQAACDGPRFRFVQGMDVSVEEGKFATATLEELD